MAALASARTTGLPPEPEHLSRQPESRWWIYLRPTCQLMLFVGGRRVGTASLALHRTAKMPIGDLKMEGEGLEGGAEGAAKAI